MKIRSILAPNPGPLTLEGTRTYLLGDSTIIDPGPIIESHIHAIAAAIPRLTTILITHRHADHAPAAVPLKTMTRARIVAPPNVLDDTVVDERLNGGERIDVDGAPLEVIATPGHTREHVCFLNEDGDLFSGDTILGNGTTAVFPPDGNMGDYMRSLRLLRERRPRRIHPAHGPTRENGTELIDEYIAHRLQREGQIVDALRSGARSIPELRADIYRELDAQLHKAAEIQLEAHLIQLIEERRVSRNGGAYSLTDRGTK